MRRQSQRRDRAALLGYLKSQFVCLEYGARERLNNPRQRICKDPAAYQRENHLKTIIVSDTCEEKCQ